uniref:Uncharacterized protein n=1 Tax=Rhizophora mucronata TaxID=61149 RepID=A0A2P2IN10_RHIMU
MNLLVACLSCNTMFRTTCLCPQKHLEGGEGRD